MNSLIGGATAPLLVLSMSCASAPLPGGAANRPSGQSRLMEQTFVAQQQCNPKSHLRPFVVEWDGTDLSSFEARASKDIVFVRYDGCELSIVEGCRPEVTGGFGSYRPVDWTAGSLEAIDIQNTGDLYAKLPLGAARLGGRVDAGEQFKMEYYVSGTTSATREALTTGELSPISACSGATHFVYGYNLGAFALGSTSEIRAEVGGSAWGFGAGGHGKHSAKADKRGGDLSACAAEGAREILGCKAPIRLTLREIVVGEHPDLAAARAVETPEALSLAGQIKASSDQEKEASARYSAATQKMLARDGKGCLSELDAHDRLDPRPDGLSTHPRSQAAGLRAQCIMLAGQCDAGKVLMRQVQEMYMASYGAEAIDQAVDNVVKDKCQSGKRSPRDELLFAWNQLQVSAQREADCDAAYATVKRLRSRVEPKSDRDYAIVTITKAPTDIAAGCFVRTKACEKAWRVYRSEESERLARDYPTSVRDDESLRARFDATHTACKP